VNTDEKRISVLHRALEEMADYIPYCGSLFYLLRDGYEDSMKKIIGQEKLF